MSAELAHTAEKIWLNAQKAFKILDELRPNPRGIKTSTMEIEVTAGRWDKPFFSAEAENGQRYCFAAWLPEGKDLVDAYYDSSILGLLSEFFSETKLRTQRAYENERIITQFEQEHSNLPDFDKQFSEFIENINVLVRGPLPPTLESVVKGRGTAVWMPKNLFLLLPPEYREIR